MKNIPIHKISPDKGIEDLLQQLDQNGDGKIKKKEVADKDGYLVCNSTTEQWKPDQFKRVQSSLYNVGLIEKFRDDMNVCQDKGKDWNVDSIDFDMADESIASSEAILNGEDYQNTVDREQTALLAAQTVAQIPDDTQAVFIGERHDSNNMTVATSALLTELRSKGFEVLCLENQDSTENIELFRQYSAGEISIEQLDEQTSIARFDDEAGRSTREGIEMMETAQQQGYEFMPIDHFDNTDGLSRDHHMAKHVRELIDAGKKVVFLVGKSHIARDPSDDQTSQEEKSKMNGILDVDGVATTELLDDDYSIYTIVLRDPMLTEEQVDDPQDVDHFDAQFEIPLQ